MHQNALNSTFIVPNTECNQNKFFLIKELFIFIYLFFFFFYLTLFDFVCTKEVFSQTIY
jgi:hypothetical protein